MIKIMVSSSQLLKPTKGKNGPKMLNPALNAFDLQIVTRIGKIGGE
jgi:hypothetical protein